MVRLCDHAMDLHVDVGGFEGIIPYREAVFNPDGQPVKDIAVLSRVGKPVCFKVLRLEEKGGRPVAYLSRRAAQEECMREWVMKLTPGDILPAKITHLEPFGAFVDMGCGIVSLLTVDCISVSRISHPSERFTPGESIMAIVKSVDPDSGRVYMTHRELLGTWEENVSRFAPTQTVSGIVRSIEPYGIFVELSPNLAGLAELREDVRVGDRCAVYIKSILPDRMKIKLAILDTLPEREPQLLTPGDYFTWSGKLHRWQYSPEGCQKQIYTDFT
jgi:small subunit ribosomal protein S1